MHGEMERIWLATANSELRSEVLALKQEIERLRSWIDRQNPRDVYEATVCPICHKATERYYMRPVEDHAVGCPWREVLREG